MQLQNLADRLNEIRDEYFQGVDIPLSAILQTLQKEIGLKATAALFDFPTVESFERFMDLILNDSAVEVEA
ncbi:MAG TPA: hypothetical protein VGA49_01855 [Patescibacteria group bacterium]